MPVSIQPEPELESDPGFAVYVHWPFCAAKCPYCDFNSHVRHGGVDEAAFVHAYVREIGYFAHRLPGRAVSSIFFGGGTPSLMAPRSVAAILEAIANVWHVSNDVEITLEANPASVDTSHFSGYRTAGVNRISIGIQSLDDDDLIRLGRLHNVGEALAALAVAQTRFDRVSCDLIYARPHQSLDAWREELSRMLDLGTGHLSLYQLTVEPGTPYADLVTRGRLSVPEPDLAADMFDLTQDLCAEAGLPAYEISNHARRGEESRHNLVYWRYGEYAGIGPGAHGRIGAETARQASVIEPHPETWRAAVMTNGHGLIGDESVTNADAAEEFLLMGLRLAEGIDENRYRSLSGHDLDPGRRDRLIAGGFLAHNAAGRLRVTAKGRPVLNRVIAELI